MRKWLIAGLLSMVAAGTAVSAMLQNVERHEPQATAVVLHFCSSLDSSGYKSHSITFGDAITINGESGIIFSVHEEPADAERHLNRLIIEWAPTPE